MSHRYWRLFFDGSANSTIRITKFELRSVSGGATLLNLSNTSARTEGASTTAWYNAPGIDRDDTRSVLDDDFQTYIQLSVSGSIDGFLEVDFGSNQSIAEVMLGSEFATIAVDQFEVQYSDDGTNWTTSDTYPAITWSNDQEQTFAVTAAGGGASPDQAIRIETFDVSVNAGDTHTLANDVGDLASAFVKINNTTRKGSAGPVGNSGNAGPRDAGRAAVLTATDTITFQGGHTSAQKIMGEVWRYEGPDGGDHEFIVRGRYQIDLAAGVASADAAVAGIVSEANCVPIVSGVVNTSGSSNTSDYDAATLGVRMDGAGNVEASRQSTGIAMSVYVTVVEFTGSSWTVASAVSSSHDSAHEVVTLSEDIGDWSTAFIEATGQGDTSETGLSDCYFHAIPEAATNQVRVEYQDGDGNARNDGTAYVYVIGHPDLVVTRGQNTNLAEGNNSYGTPITIPGAAQGVDDSLQALEWFVDTSGVGTAHHRGALAARIVGDQIQHWVHRQGNNINARYGVIDVSALTFTASSETSADGTATGTASVSGSGKSIPSASGDASGLAAVSGFGASIVQSVGTSSASSTVAGTGSAISTAIGSADGLSAVSGDASSVARTQGSSAGVSSAVGATQSVAESQGLSSGQSSATGSGASVARTDGAASGASAASGVGGKIATANGSVSAGATVSASSAQTQSGAATGFATVSGQGRSIVNASGSVVCAANVNGQGASIKETQGLSSAGAFSSGQAASIAQSNGAASAQTSVAGQSFATHVATGSTLSTVSIVGDGKVIVRTTGLVAGQATAAGVGSEASTEFEPLFEVPGIWKSPQVAGVWKAPEVFGEWRNFSAAGQWQALAANGTWLHLMAQAEWQQLSVDAEWKDYSIQGTWKGVA